MQQTAHRCTTSAYLNNISLVGSSRVSSLRACSPDWSAGSSSRLTARPHIENSEDNAYRLPHHKAHEVSPFAGFGASRIFIPAIALSLSVCTLVPFGGKRALPDPCTRRIITRCICSYCPQCVIGSICQALTDSLPRCRVIC